MVMPTSQIGNDAAHAHFVSWQPRRSLSVNQSASARAVARVGTVAVQASRPFGASAGGQQVAVEIDGHVGKDWHCDAESFVGPAQLEIERQVWRQRLVPRSGNARLGRRGIRRGFLLPARRIVGTSGHGHHAGDPELAAPVTAEAQVGVEIGNVERRARLSDPQVLPVNGTSTAPSRNGESDASSADAGLPGTPMATEPTPAISTRSPSVRSVSPCASTRPLARAAGVVGESCTVRPSSRAWPSIRGPGAAPSVPPIWASIVAARLPRPRPGGAAESGRRRAPLERERQPRSLEVIAVERGVPGDAAAQARGGDGEAVERERLAVEHEPSAPVDGDGSRPASRPQHERLPDAHVTGEARVSRGQALGRDGRDDRQVEAERAGRALEDARPELRPAANVELPLEVRARIEAVQPDRRAPRPRGQGR